MLVGQTISSVVIITTIITVDIVKLMPSLPSPSSRECVSAHGLLLKECLRLGHVCPPGSALGQTTMTSRFESNTENKRNEYPQSTNICLLVLNLYKRSSCLCLGLAPDHVRHEARIFIFILRRDRTTAHYNSVLPHTSPVSPGPRLYRQHL